MSLKADRQAFGATREAAELVQGAFVGRDFRRKAVVFIANVIIEGPRTVFVDQA
ncbi:hypothetical protein D3C84_1297900 [compost metagenome]